MADEFSPQEQKKNLPDWLWIAIVPIVLLVLAGAILFVFSILNDRGAEVAEVEPVTIVGPRAEKYSYTGTIIEKGNDFIRVLAPAGENSLSRDKEVVVSISATTKIRKLSIPQRLPENASDDEIRGLFKLRDTSFASLKVGDSVTATSASNVAEVSSFIADRIDVRNIQ